MCTAARVLAVADSRIDAGYWTSCSGAAWGADRGQLTAIRQLVTYINLSQLLKIDYRDRFCGHSIDYVATVICRVIWQLLM